MPFFSGKGSADHPYRSLAVYGLNCITNALKDVTKQGASNKIWGDRALILIYLQPIGQWGHLEVYTNIWVYCCQQVFVLFPQIHVVLFL